MRKTVVLLGAGASHGSAYRLPLMAELLNAVGTAPYRNLEKALGLLGGAAGADLEDFLTQLDLTRLVLLERWRATASTEFSQIVNSARLELELFLGDQLTHDGGGSWDHMELFRRLGARDTILSVNYDLIADTALLEISGRELDGTPKKESVVGRSYDLLRSGMFDKGIPAGLTVMERESGFFLKLHGSIAWLSCPRSECSRHQEIIEPGNEHPGVRPQHGDPCRSCGATLRRVIVSPTLVKQLEEHPRLELLWRLAHGELARADEIVIIGLSLPRSDARLKWLLSSSQIEAAESGQRPRLIVVNPDREATIRAEKACRLECKKSYQSMTALLQDYQGAG